MIEISKEESEELNKKKALQFLKPLLYNIKEEEKEISEKVQRLKKVRDIDFTKSFMICSSMQVYKSVSVYGIVNFYNRGIKYKVMSLSMLLDVWYSSYDATNIYTKDALRTCDILIINGNVDSVYGERKAAVLVDLLRERRGYGKITWLFIEDVDIYKIKHSYPGVLEELKDSNVYILDFNKTTNNVKEEIKDVTNQNINKESGIEEESRETQKDNRNTNYII